MKKGLLMIVCAFALAFCLGSCCRICDDISKKKAKEEARSRKKNKMSDSDNEYYYSKYAKDRDEKDYDERDYEDVEKAMAIIYKSVDLFDDIEDMNMFDAEEKNAINAAGKSTKASLKAIEAAVAADKGDYRTAVRKYFEATKGSIDACLQLVY